MEDPCNFHLSGKLSSEGWELSLSYPEDTIIPDLSKLGKVFGEGEGAMRKILSATSDFRDINDVARVKGIIQPHLKPVKDAIEAVKGIAKAPAKGVSVGISVGTPDPLPGQTSSPRGVQGQVTVTYRF